MREKCGALAFLQLIPMELGESDAFMQLHSSFNEQRNDPTLRHVVIIRNNHLCLLQLHRSVHRLEDSKRQRRSDHGVRRLGAGLERCRPSRSR